MLYSKHWESNKQGHERVDDFGVGYTFAKGMALTTASASSRRVVRLIIHPRSKGIPVTFSPALFRYREATS